MKKVITIIYDEFKSIGTNISVLIVLILGNVGYGFLYNLLYNTNVYRNAPIAVVDMSQSDISRHLIDYIDATQQVEVSLKTQNYDEARQMLIERKIVGFLYIPSELKEQLMRGNQAKCIIYGSTLSFLDYLNISEAVNYATLEINSELLPEMLKTINMIDLMFLVNGKAVNIVAEPLYNNSEGYGTYLIPPVLMLIIFQTMMIVISMNETSLVKRSFRYVSMSPYIFVFAKALSYFLIYLIFSIFFLIFIPLLFDLPHLSNFLNIITLMIPYLFANIYFCLIFTLLFKDADSPLFFIVFMSVPLVFLSGISYPLELMPWHWKIFHYIIPAAPATMAFVKLNCMGADMNNITSEMINLWLQCIGYYIIAATIRVKKGKRVILS